MGNKTRKKEARLKINLEKLSNNNKNVRLSDSVEIKGKYIRSSEIPDLTKTPRSKSPENYKNYFFSWCTTHSDTSGDWSWIEARQWSDKEYSQTINPHMNAHNNDSWNDVENKTYNGKGHFRKRRNKYQPLDSLCVEAQQRWLELELLSQFEELFRFRLGSYKRIWGIRIQHHFYLVWYERKHKICPMDK